LTALKRNSVPRRNIWEAFHLVLRKKAIYIRLQRLQNARKISTWNLRLNIIRHMKHFKSCKPIKRFDIDMNASNSDIEFHID
jgi:hypothetical protein